MNRLALLLPNDIGETADVKLYSLADLGTQVGTTIAAARQTRSRYYFAETAITAGEYSADVFDSSGAWVASRFITVEPITAADRASDYATRLATHGKTLSASGRAMVESVFQAAIDEGVEITSGWLFGSEVNLASPSRVVNLSAAGGDLVPEGTLDGSTANSAALLGLRVGGSGNGLTTESGEPLFTADSDYSVLLVGNFNGDTDTVTAGRQLQPLVLDQEASSSLPGNVALVMTNQGALQWIDRTASSITPPGDLYSDNMVAPTALWWAFGTNPSYRVGHARGAYSSSLSFAGDPSGVRLRLGGYNSGHEGDLGFACLLRFDGALSDSQRSTIFAKVWGAWRTIGRAALCIGNSVTISGSSNSSLTWPKRLQRWGVYNNLLLDRLAQGARRLPYFAPTGYELPGPPADSDIAVRPVDGWEWFAPNVLINDDQQNMIAAGHPWASFLDCHNAIVAFFAALNTDQRAIICTQIAHAPYEFGTYNPLTFSQVQLQRQRFLDATVAARAESAYNGVPTTVGEVYAPFNLGWDTPDDGDAPDPVDDLPNGDTSLFATSDAQHPNDAGHLLMFNAYKDALEAVLLL